MDQTPASSSAALREPPSANGAQAENLSTATSPHEVYAGKPFFGTVKKVREEGEDVHVAFIEPDEPVTLAGLLEKHPAAFGRLRIETMGPDGDGVSFQINVGSSNQDRGGPTQPQLREAQRLGEHSAQRQIQSLEQTIQHLERRLQTKEDEIDSERRRRQDERQDHEKEMRKLRRRKDDRIETLREKLEDQRDEAYELRSQLQQIEHRLRSKIQEKENELARERIEREKDQGLGERLLEGFVGEGLPLLKELAEKASTDQSGPSRRAIAGRIGEAAQERGEDSNHEGGPDMVTIQINGEQDTMPRSQLAERATRLLVEAGKRALASDQFQPSDYAEYFEQVRGQLDRHGEEISTQGWMQIAHQITSYAVSENVDADTLADYLDPVLRPIFGDSSWLPMIKAAGAETAVNSLYRAIGQKPPEKHRGLVEEVVAELLSRA